MPRTVLDATPLLGRRTGVGRYVSSLLAALVADQPDGERLGVTAFTWRGAEGLSDLVPPGVDVVHRRAPARVLQALWTRLPTPPVELLAGRCDVFHATNFVLPPMRRASGVVMVHDLSFAVHPDVVTPAVLRYQRLVPRSVARAAVVVCPSEAMAAEVRAHYGLPADRVRATPLGVDPAWSSAVPLDAAGLRALGLPERYLLFVGTREPRKGLPALLAAHVDARAADPDVPPLVLTGPAGWGPALDLPEGILTTGWLKEADLRSVVASATALALVSRYEGFGLPLLEALACGTPVVASDLPVFREVVGGHGALVAPGDRDALAAALVAASTAAPDEDARQARREWSAQFTWARCARLTRVAYADAAA